jgi:V/A-type H+-transporting ATPase subunit D
MVAPTKTNLLKLQSELKFAVQGHELLDQKRNILITELISLVDQGAHLEEQTRDALRKAYRTLEEAVLKMGKLSVLTLGSGINIEAEISLNQRKIMGVGLPVVETDFKEFPPFYSPSGVSSRVDGALENFKEALKTLGKLAELRVSIMRLAHEVRKTIRKVNALEKVAIPNLKGSLHYIQMRLEENERDMFVLMKMVKSRLEKRKERDG